MTSEARLAEREQTLDAWLEEATAGPTVALRVAEAELSDERCVHADQTARVRCASPIAPPTHAGDRGDR